MQALVHRHPKLVCDSICHIEPMQLRVKQACQAAVVLLRAAHNSRCSIHDPLQLVSNRLWCSGQHQIAIVDPGRNKGVNQYGCRFVSSLQYFFHAPSVTSQSSQVSPPDLWPPNSPYLNPVDYRIWGLMQQAANLVENQVFSRVCSWLE